jgi:hypothetical protein
MNKTCTAGDGWAIIQGTGLQRVCSHAISHAMNMSRTLYAFMASTGLPSQNSSVASAAACALFGASELKCGFCSSSMRFVWRVQLRAIVGMRPHSWRCKCCLLLSCAAVACVLLSCAGISCDASADCCAVHCDLCGALLCVYALQLHRVLYRCVGQSGCLALLKKLCRFSV